MKTAWRLTEWWPLAQALFLALSGCATSPVPLDVAKQVPAERISMKSQPGLDAATVTFVRDSGALGSAVLHHLFINDEPAARLEPGEAVSFHLQPGDYVFSVVPTDPFGTKARMSTDVTLRPRGQYFYRLQTDGDSFLTVIQRFIPRESEPAQGSARSATSVGR